MKNTTMMTVAVALLLAWTLVNSVFVVDQRQRALLFQFGELRGQNYEPGLHLKLPFFQAVRTFDGRVLTLDNQTENFLTVEKKNVEVDYYVKWQIADPAVYYRSTRGQELVAMDRLASIVNRALRDEFGSRTIQQAVSDERNAIMTDLRGSVESKLKDLGINIIDVRLKSINLPQAASDSVYDRMRSERARVATDLRARGAEEAEKIRATADQQAQILLADAYKQAEQLKGEGDAKAAAIYAKSFGQDPEFYSFYRSLTVYKDSLGGQGDVMVLHPDSPFFKYFKNSGS
ncbi:membrane protease subunit HflC [Solimonas aquatica]|uniref:Protein HflC n=1 Tax=Solimonas aquatica TaxID=489703 RepID=A0A1H9IV09_9GAMM|nr:protease modulator HflC [Solimonas aquatica]SEQ78414.1 membrane protease subunit HflC [Solimonas aquatica]